MQVKKSKYNQTQINIIRENYPSGGSTLCQKLSGLNPSVIRSIANKNKILRNPSFNSYNFKNIQTPEAAYILGLLWADGSIGNDGKIVIGMVSEDLDSLIDIFLKTGNWKVRNYIPKQNNKKPVTIISCANVEFSRYLEKYDYIAKTNASADKILSIIPNNLRRYWFRGLIDGDGCFSKSAFSCYSSYNQDWKYFISLCESLGVKYSIDKRNRISKENGRIHQSSNIRISNKNDILKLGNYIYSDYLIDGIGLSRKYNKYLEIVKLIPFRGL